MKILFDLLPVVAFFIVFQWMGIFVATATAIVLTLLQMLYCKLRYGKIEHMLLLSGVVISVFGGATLFFRNPLFIQWKPTVLYWLLAVGFLIAQYVYRVNPLQKMLGSQLQLPAKLWLKLVWAWSTLFGLLGVLNLFVAFHYSQAEWVYFKLFGVSGIMLIFIVAQTWWLRAYLK